MRLHRFLIHNFKGIEDACFEWDDLIVLIGENNCGKSTTLQALDCFLGGSQIKDPALFHNNLTGIDNAVELIGYFNEITETERQNLAIRGRMNAEEWVIKKRFWLESDDEVGGQRSTWKEQYYSFSCGQDTFMNWPESDSSWANFPQEYQDLIANIPDRGRPNEHAREALRDLVRERKPHLVTAGEPQWVPNPGGGGNWKSNANSIIPRLVFVKAVRDATDEATSKEASTYGKIISLIVEKKMINRPEVSALKVQFENVLRLFRPDPVHPDLQAEEIRGVQHAINLRLNEIIDGTVSIKTSDLDVGQILLPNTTLVVKDRPDSVETTVAHQGHGLQRVLIMTLLQILADIEISTDETTNSRSVILAVEEPELYMHPQMQRKMRDALQKLASQEGFQVICTTHSPVFLDVAQRSKSIVRVVRSSNAQVSFFQVTEDLFDGPNADSERDRLRLIASFHPTVNEVFFSRRVVLLEERTALSAFERAAELTGIFARHPKVRRDVTLIDCNGKMNIPMFERVLNHFRVPYIVVHDEDRGNPVEESRNAMIEGLLHTAFGQNQRHMISPANFEQMLGYAAAGKDKPYQALKRVEELHAANSIPVLFMRALNWVYFGQDTEPPNNVDSSGAEVSQDIR